jgi:histidinol-phosphate aminotransferase
VSWVARLARPDIVALESYTCPVDEPGFARLHANELPWRSLGDASEPGLNRYPAPQPPELIAALARLYGVDSTCVLATRGTDEGIDLLVRAFCRAGLDAVIVCPPTFVMYAIAAGIQGADVIRVPLERASCFALEPHTLLAHCTGAVKLVFLCSPNSPTGNLMSAAAILEVADALCGRALVVVDEAYIEFASHESLAQRLLGRPQLVLLRTLSKAHALAGARCGSLIADPEIISLLRKIIAPFPLPRPTADAALQALAPPQLAATRTAIARVCAERNRLLAALPALLRIGRVWPSDANFILAELADPDDALARARAARLLVRDARVHVPGALRITVGSADENDRLLEAWS